MTAPTKRSRGRPRKPITFCLQPECGRVVQARGLCHGHYKQLRRGHALSPLRVGHQMRLTLRLPEMTEKHLDQLAKALRVSRYEAGRRALIHGAAAMLKRRP